MIRALFLCLALLLTASGLAAQGRGDRFDGDRLSARDVRFLQGALTLQGTYEGMLDGDWGRLSRQALDAYLARTDARRAGEALADLVRGFRDEVDRRGWTAQEDGVSGLSYLLPTRLLSRDRLSNLAQKVIARNGEVKSWASEDGALRLTRIEEPARDARDRHAALLQRHAPADAPYTLRDDRRWITTAESAAGERFYLLSVATADDWVSYEVRASEKHWRRLSLIAGSFLREPGIVLAPEPGGRLDRIVTGMSPSRTPPPRIETRPLPDPSPGGNHGRRQWDRDAGGGTGTYVNSVDLVTAAHVLGDCAAPQLADGSPLSVLARDETLGVAVLTGERRSRDWIAFDRRGDLRKGDAILAVGYGDGRPRGFSAIAGRIIAPAERRAGRGARLVFGARLSAGLSGGAVVDGEGMVQGIVVSQPAVMDALAQGGAIGADTALAVPAAALAAFLRDKLVTLDQPRASGSLEDRSRTLRAATVAIECGGF